MDLGDFEDLETRYQKFPITTKSDLREFTWKGYVPHSLNFDEALENGVISLVQTSGTTEDRVTNIWYQEWWDESEKQSWKYNSHLISEKLGNHFEIILTSPHNTGFLSNEADLSFENRKLGRFLYLNEKSNPLFWNKALMERMVSDINQFKPLMIEANPVYLSYLSDFIRSESKKIFQPKIISLTYENPSILSRKLIQSAFSCPVISSYGSTETGYVLMECEHGYYHQNSESCRIDFQPLKSQYGSPSIGRIFVTPFHNPWRVLIKFDVGDLVSLPDNDKCLCGKNNGYRFKDIEGRVSNLTFTTNGSCVTPKMLDRQVSLFNGIINYQLIQNKFKHYLLYIKINPSIFNPKNISSLKDKLFELYGKDATISVEKVDEIQAELSGKYRHSKCLFEFNPNEYFQ